MSWRRIGRIGGEGGGDIREIGGDDVMFCNFVMCIK